MLTSRATDDLGRRQPATISEPDAWRNALDNDEFPGALDNDDVPWNEGGCAANAYEPDAVDVAVEIAASD